MSESMVIEGGKQEETETSERIRETATSSAVRASVMSREEKRKALKKEKRKQKRKELAEKARQEENALFNDPEEERRIQLEEEREKERMERERKEFEEREKLFLEALARQKAEEEEEERKRAIEEEESKQNQLRHENELNGDDDWEYVEEGPPEIIWQGNEIIVKKKKVRIKKKDKEQQDEKEDPNRPTSNPLPPQSEAFADHKNASTVSAQQLLENVAQQVPNFGTELDKAHCPFHLKTGACRFGSRCSRVHFYPDKSCTLLIKNMYNGPGLAWEQDEGLELFLPRFEHTDEEVERCYEEFYEDVHTEFLKFGEIVNFKVCRNGSFHLRGNVYVHYKSLDSAVLAYHSTHSRYFAGKQVKCEFVSLTRWKVAICGEYMKSRLKTCSRGTACNFIHCFRNPGGDYEWANWDKPPPKYWVKKMAALFGYSDEYAYDKQTEQENSGQMRNSSKMLTADRDRYHSRRSRSRERDYSDRSSRRHYEEQNDRRSVHQRRHTSDGRKRPKVIDENYEDATYSRNKHHNNRNHDTDSDGDWSDRDRYEDSKSRTHETDSDGELADTDRDRDRHHGRTRKSSRHRKVSGILEDFKESKDKTCGTDFDGGLLDEEGDRPRHQNERRKSSRHRHKVSVSPDDHWDSRSRTYENDTSGGLSDKGGDRHHSRTRKRSSHSNDVSGLSDDNEESKKVLTKKVQQRESDGAKLEVQSVGKHSHSSGRKRPSRETNEADFLDEANDQRIKSHDVGSRYDFEKHKKFKRKITIDESLDPESPGRYHGRSKSDDSGCYNNKNIDERNRWEPDKGVLEEHDV